MINELKDFGCAVSVYDPWADREEVQREYGFETISKDSCYSQDWDAIVVAVAHNEFRQMDASLFRDRVVFDIKGLLPKDIVSARL